MFGIHSSTAAGIGWCVQGFNVASGQSVALTGANPPVAFSALGFTAPKNGSLTSVSVYFSGLSGTPLDVRVSVYADVYGTPSSSGPIAGSESVGITAVANAWNSFTLPNVPVVQGQYYHLVFKNYTPSTSASLLYLGSGSPAIGNSNSLVWGHTRHSTTAGDAAWITTGAGSTAAYWATMSDGTNLGLPYRISARNLTVPTVTGNSITIPRNIGAFRCGGVQFKLAKTGSFTTGVVARIVGLIDSILIPQQNIYASFNMLTFYFPQSVVLYGGETIRVVLETTEGSNTNYYRTTDIITDPLAPAYIPYNMIKTTSMDGGTTWTDTPGSFVEMYLIGTHLSEFEDVPTNRRQFSSMR